MRPLKFELETVDNFRRGYREDKRNALQMERKQDSINKSPNYAQIFSCFALPRSKKNEKANLRPNRLGPGHSGNFGPRALPQRACAA